MQLEDLLQAQERLQRDLGIKFEEMSPAQVIEYVRWNALALIVEVTETLNETEWKPWKLGDSYINSTHYRGELADVFIFMMNLMLAEDISADEMMDHVSEKISINRRRLT